MNDLASISLNLKPILEEATKDEKLWKDAFSDGKLIPYAGSAAKSTHRLARVLKDLSVLSDSRGSVHQDIISYSFDNGELEIQYRNRTGFAKRGGREVPEQIADSYIDVLSDIGVNGAIIKQNAKELCRAYLCWGFAVQLTDLAKVGDQSAINFKAVGLDHCLILKGSNGNLSIVYFPNGIEKVSDSTEHYIYPIYETVSQIRENAVFDSGFTRYAMIVRNGQGPYGRPQDQQAIRSMIIEASLTVHDEKVSTAPTTARGIVTYPQNPHGTYEMQAQGDSDQSPTEADLAAEAVRKVRETLDKNDLGFLGFKGDVKPELLKIDINRDANHRALMNQLHSSKIYAANRWSTDLTGLTQPTGGIGSSYLRDMIAFKNYTVIQGMQSKIESVQNDSIVALAIQDERFQDISHAFPDPLKKFGDFGLASTNDTQNELQ